MLAHIFQCMHIVDVGPVTGSRAHVHLMNVRSVLTTNSDDVSL